MVPGLPEVGHEFGENLVLEFALVQTVAFVEDANHGPAAETPDVGGQKIDVVAGFGIFGVEHTQKEV